MSTGKDRKGRWGDIYPTKNIFIKGSYTMKKIDKLLSDVKTNSVEPYVDYHFDKLTEEELEAVIDDSTSDERKEEILEKVRYISTDPNSIRKKIERMSDEEADKLLAHYKSVSHDKEDT